MSILKPLEWSKNLVAKSPLHEYRIESYNKGASVIYCATGKSAKEATGFVTIEDAQKWAEFTHYPSKMQPYINDDTIDSYFDKFTGWATDRQIIQNGNVLAQGLKLVSEIGELADNLAKGRCIKDDIGDCMVVLNNLAQMTDTPLSDCLAQAWGDIKDRKGHMNEHGVFIKEGDIA